MVQRELELATLQAELHSFKARYLSIVGVQYAELDEIEAQLNPKDNKIQKQTAQARAQAQELEEWESNPESVDGEGTAVELVRVICKMAQF